MKAVLLDELNLHRIIHSLVPQAPHMEIPKYRYKKVNLSNAQTAPLLHAKILCSHSHKCQSSSKSEHYISASLFYVFAISIFTLQP
jgi:hypothetical protein